MDAAFRAGQGAYVQQQGPFPQQLEADGIGHIVAQVGPADRAERVLVAWPRRREWLETDEARAFTRAYRKTRDWMNETPAAEIARAEKEYFPKTDEAVLADCIATYQKLGCWTPHVEITKPAFEVAQDVFEHFGTLKTARALGTGLLRPAGRVTGVTGAGTTPAFPTAGKRRPARRGSPGLFVRYYPPTQASRPSARSVSAPAWIARARRCTKRDGCDALRSLGFGSTAASRAAWSASAHPRRGRNSAAPPPRRRRRPRRTRRC